MAETDGSVSSGEKRLSGMEQIEAERRAAGVDELFAPVLEIRQSPSSHIQVSSKVSPSESFLLLAAAAFELLRSVSRHDVQEFLMELSKAKTKETEAPRRIIVPDAVGMKAPRPT